MALRRAFLEAYSRIRLQKPLVSMHECPKKM
jgi:hypothetical protein